MSFTIKGGKFNIKFKLSGKIIQRSLIRLLGKDKFYGDENNQQLLIKHFSKQQDIDIKKIEGNIKSVRVHLPKDQPLNQIEETRVLCHIFIAAGLTCYINSDYTEDGEEDSFYSDTVYAGEYYDTTHFLCTTTDELETFLRYEGWPLPETIFPVEESFNHLIKNNSHTPMNNNSRHKGDIEVEFNNQLKIICPEVEMFFNALIEDLDLRGNYGSINEIEQSELHQIACEYFNDNHMSYNMLVRENIEDINIYKNVQRRRRRIVGVILQKFLKLNLHSAIDHKRIDTNIDSLLNKHNSIIK